MEHAVRVIKSACYMAGSRDLVRELRASANGRKIRAATAGHDTPPLFDWLIETLSYQGIADRVAEFEPLRVVSKASQLLALLRLPLPKEPRDLRRAEPHQPMSGADP
jgi:hypothetical protein